MNNKKTIQKISGELTGNMILQTSISRDFSMMVTAQSINNNKALAFIVRNQIY